MKGRVRKHNIDIMFLMALFLIFTFSTVSVLLMAVNSYRNVVYANEANSDARTAIAYIRERVRANDEADTVYLDEIDGCGCIRIAEEDGYSLYIYAYGGYLMELEAKDGAGVTADFGNKILKVGGLSLSREGEDGPITAVIEDNSGDVQTVVIGVRSGGGQVR